MTAILCMHPGDAPMSWEEFYLTKPPFSVALDGYVNTGPRFNPTGPWANFNHHEEVDRLATRATCGQVLIAIRQGLFECFRDGDAKPKINVYANDCDEDVCLAVFLLKHSYMVDHTINPLLNRLVNMEDLLDATAGAYPFPDDLPALQEMAWIFDPYRRFRLSGGVERKDSDAFSGVVSDVDLRIQKYLIGQGSSLPLDMSYTKIGGGPGWTMVKETGPQARTGMFSDGIRAYLSIRERPDGRLTCTLGRMSVFIPFDIPRIVNAFNLIEDTPYDPWGGGNTVAGSPRIGGTKLSPAELQRIINDIIGCKDDKAYAQVTP